MRALAVLMVVAYHGGLALPGGFTGPDVFFVVSGFVITRMLLREWSSSQGIDIGRFYLRRVRRLLPALAIVSIATLALAAVMLSPIGPSQMMTAHAARAAATITANLYFFRQTGGYFQPIAQDNPLLHTWSLSVEEQFYLVFPIALLGLLRLDRGCGGVKRTTLILGLAFLASFGASLVLSYGLLHGVWPRLATRMSELDSLRLAFFSPVTRTWEFLAGVLLALAGARWTPGPLLRGAAAVAGLALLVVTVVTVRATDVFPGTVVIMPVIGTVGLLIGGLGSPVPLVTRLLSTPPLVWIGDRSYGWYLWHWPLIVFARSSFAGQPHAPLVAAVVALVPSMLSFRFVEEPIRRGHTWPSAKAGLGIAAISVALPLACALAFTTAIDRAWGSAEIARIRDAAAPDHLDITAGCASPAPLGDPGRAPCVWPVAASRGTLLLIGDSNAGHFSEPFIAAAHSLGYDAQLATMGACPFVRRPTYHSASCRGFVEDSLAAIARREPAYAGIVIANSMGYVNGALAPRFVADAAPGAPITRPAEIAGWVASLKRAIENIAPRSPIVVVGAVPHFGPLLECLHPTLFSGPDPGCGVVTPASIAASRTDLVAEERAAVRAAGATYLDAGGVLCPAGEGCSAFMRGQVVYRDRAHLSVEGSMNFESNFREALAAATRLDR
jgi:peptidoglycan/LPS O-acetylase OafA/YrhL